SSVRDERKMKKSSAPAHLQIVIEPDLEGGAFVEPQIAIHKESRDGAGGCSNTSANGSTAPASSHCAADCAYTRACASSFYLVPFVHASALNLAFLIGRLHAVLDSHTSSGGDLWNPDVVCFH